MRGRDLCIVSTLEAAARIGCVVSGEIHCRKTWTMLSAVLPMGRRKGPSVIVNLETQS